MTSLQKRLILIVCTVACTAQTPVHSMDRLQSIMRSTATTTTSLWNNATFRKAFYAYLMVCLIREAYTQYYKKNSSPVEKLLWTPVRGTFVQPLKLPIDVTKSCIKYCWNLLQNNPRFTYVFLNIPATLGSGFISSLLSSSIINSKPFERILQHLTKTEAIDSVKNEWMKILFSSTDSMIRPTIHTALHNAILYDEVKHHEDLQLGKTGKNSELGGLEEIDLTEQAYFGDLPNNLQSFVANINHTNSKINKIASRTFLLYGPPGNGKTAAGVEALKRAGCTRGFIFHAGKSVSKWGGEAGERARNAYQQIIEMAKNDPDNIYGLFTDEIEIITRVRSTSDHGYSQNSSDTTGTVLNCLDDMDKQPNAINISATNVPDGVDNAIYRRFNKYNSKAEVGIPDAQQRANIIQKYIEKNGCSIDETTLQQFVTSTEKFSAAGTTNFTHGICIEMLKKNQTQITQDTPTEIINDALFKSITSMIDEYRQAVETTKTTFATSKNVEKAVQAFNRNIEDLEIIKSKVQKKLFEAQVKLKLDSLQQAFISKQQPQVISQLIQECSHILEQQYNTLLKTPEQEIFEAAIRALEQGNISAAQKELEKLDTTKSSFETSLNRQMMLLESIIKNFQTLESAKNVLAQYKISGDLIDQLNHFNNTCTYYNDESNIYNITEFNQKISVEKQQCNTISNAINAVHAPETVKNFATEQKSFVAIKATKQTLNDYIQEKTSNIISQLSKKNIKDLQKQIKDLSNVVLTSDQLKLKALIDGIDPLKHENELTAKDIEKLLKDYVSQALPKESIVEITEEDLNKLVEVSKPETSIREIKLDVVTESQSQTTKKATVKRTGSLDGFEFYSPQPVQTQQKSVDLCDIFATSQELATYKKIAKQQHNSTGGVWWIPLSGYVCKAPKASAQEKNIFDTVSRIALFLQKLMSSITPTGTSGTTYTPENLVIMAHALQEEKPEIRTKKLCALIAGCQQNDTQTLELFGKPNCTKQEVVELLEQKSKMVCIKKNDETVDADAVFLELHKEHFERDAESYTVECGLSGQKPKKVEDSAKLFAQLKQFDKIASFGSRQPKK